MYDRKKLNEIQEKRYQWQETTLNSSQERLPERKEQFITTSSDPVERLYTPLDAADFNYLESLGFPGEYPYTRGVHPTMHRGRLWTMRMFAGLVPLKRPTNASSTSLTRVKPGFRSPSIYQP